MDFEHFVDLSGEAIRGMGRRERLKLVNCLSGFKSANLVGTQDGEGRHNLAVFSSCVHLGSSPALLGLIFRPDVVPRHTLENIRQSRIYTINAIAASFYRQAHRTSEKYPEGVSEFAMVGLKPEVLSDWEAPFVAGSPLQIGMRALQEIPIPINGTTLLVGEVMRVRFAPTMAGRSVQNADGGLDLEALGLVAIGGVDQYYAGRFLEQMPYDKVERTVTM